MRHTLGPWARAGILAVATAIVPAAGQAGGTLVLGMTAADIPTSTGAPDQGAEGIRWMGFTIYDSLLYWDLNQGETVPGLVPALAHRWYPNPEDNTEWIFELRDDVYFHDGSKFTADAVIWNLEKLFVEDAPQYDLQQRGAVGWRLPGLSTWRKIDDYTVAIGDAGPNSLIPEQVVFMHISSPAHWEAVGGWAEFARNPSGTGPFRVVEIVPRERAVLERNDNYYEESRIPKLDQVILVPLPESSTRTSALLSGQVNFIEAPSPDAIPRMRNAGMQIVSNPYPHVWPYVLRLAGENTPMTDVRVRRALNLAIDRDAIVELLGGMASPARGHVLPGSPWFGNPEFELRHDPEAARALLAEAGYGPGNPLRFTVMISPSGSGQMQPIPMNELIQQQMAEVGIQLEFQVTEWQAMRAQRGRGPLHETAQAIHGLNNSFGTPDAYSAFERFFLSDLLPPTGLNWNGLMDPEMDALLMQVRQTFDQDEQDAILRQIHERVVNEAYWLWVVHDVQPRAMHPSVRGFTPAMSWYADLTQVYIEP